MIEKYLLGTFVYGGLHKIPVVWNAHYTKKNNDGSIPLLFVDKVALTLIGAVSGPYMWPVYLYKDAVAVELGLFSVRGVVQEDHKEKRSLLDYWFE
jgi:hypothetical protein